MKIPNFIRKNGLKLLTLCLLFGCVGSAHAAQPIVSAADGDWNTGGTWVGGVSPGMNDDVVIDPTHDITITTAVQAKSLTLNNTSTVTNVSGSIIVHGAVIFNGVSPANAVLDISPTDTVGSISGIGTFKDGKFGTDNTSTIFDGILTDAIKTGIGTTVLTLNNGVATKLAIEDGTIQIGNSTIFNVAAGGGIKMTGGVLNLNNYNVTIRTLGGTSGDIFLGVGSLTVNTTSGDTDIIFGGAISGEGNFTKSGTGPLTLNGTCYYSGSTTIGAGTLLIGLNGLPDGTAVNVAAGAILSGDASFTGTQVKDIGALTGSGSITLNGLLRVGGDDSSSTFSGSIANMEKAGSGVLTLDNATPNLVATGSQVLSVRSGVLQLGTNDVLSTTAKVKVFNGAFLDLNNKNQTITALDGQGDIFFGNGVDNTLTVAGAVNSSFFGTINGADIFDSLVLNGSSSSVVTTLGGNNSYRGVITVSGGVLVNNGTFPIQNYIDVGTSGILGGSGNVGALTVSGKVNPGPGVGQTGELYCTDVYISPTGTLVIDINNQPTPPDKLRVSGDVYLDPTATLKIDLSAYTPPGGFSQSFTVLESTGSVSGTFGTIDSATNGTGKPIIVTYTNNSVIVSVGDAPPSVDLNGFPSGNNFTTSFTEGTQPIALADQFSSSISDLEGSTITSLTVTLTNPADGASEFLTADTTGTPIIGTYNTVTGILALTGSAPTNQYVSVLRKIKYVNTQINPTTAPARIITFSASDGNSAGQDSTATVSIINVDLAPIVDLNGSGSGSNYAGTFTEDGGPVPASIGNTMMVLEDGGGIISATVVITNLLNPGLETLSATTTGTPIVATFTTNTLSLTGAASVTDYQQVMRTISYNNTSQHPNTTARSITFRVHDGTTLGPISTTTMTVLSVDDVPSFVKGADQSVAEDTVAQTVAGWATSLSVGPVEEAAQTLTFVVTNDSPSLFSVQPAVSPTGTLTYTPATDKNGTAIVSVSIKDNGTTANGGVDTSAAQTFKITLTPVSDIFVVNTTSDSGAGSLRDILGRAGSSDTVTFDPNVFDLSNSDAATVINLASPLPALSSGNVIVDASDRRVSINGSAAGNSYGLDVSSSSNTIRGLTIISFTSSGIAIRNGAASNIIGGSRSSGTGPNGLGLRISNCGAFGIEISGVGTNSNIIRGCWLGLDKSGLISQPNLAGILIQGGAKSNIIGSANSSEANIISGNAFEGVTVSGVGTDDNVIIGNYVGTIATANVSKARDLFAKGVGSRDVEGSDNSAGNGSSGVFMSRGTQQTVMGGSGSGEGNAVGFNGGNGVEVRASTSKRNSLKSNRIGSNKSGGIKLFDGSNNGVTKPTISTVTKSSSASTARDSSAAAEESGFSRTTVVGTATSGGSVEVYNDSGSQGSVYISKVEVVNGVWTLETVLETSKNVTATYTDSDGNTSEFEVHAGSGSGGSTDFGVDTDLDGIADALEVLAGTDPNLISDVPTDGGTVKTTKINAGFNFASAGAGKDTLKMTLTFTPPTGFTILGSTAVVAIGGYMSSVVLDVKGSSPTTAASVMKLKLAKTLGTLQFSSKGTLAASLASTIFTDRTVSNETTTLPVAVALTSGTLHQIYQGSVKISYTAKTGGKGTVKLSK